MEPMFPKEMTHNSMGRMKLGALFVETHRPGDEPFLSLKAQKDNGYVSLRDLFIQYVVDDPSEATFAEVVFGDMEHWNQLLACNWMDEHVTKWRAICDGIDGKLIDFGIEQEVPLRFLMNELLELIDDVVDELGSRREVEYVHTILNEGTSADRQLRVYRETGDLKTVVDLLAEETMRDCC